MNDDPIWHLILGPGDQAHFLAHAADGGGYYAVVHRRHGLWTHLYRVTLNPRRDRTWVRLEACFPGACPERAQAWLGAKAPVRA